jgi:hypothetical protein
MKQYLKWILWILVMFFFIVTVILYQQNQANKSELYNLQIEIFSNHNESIVRALEENDIKLLEESNNRIKGLSFTHASDVENLSLVMMLYESALTEVIEEGLEDNDIIMRYFTEIGDKIIEASRKGLNNSTNIDRFLEEIINDMNELKEEVIPNLKVN